MPSHLNKKSLTLGSCRQYFGNDQSSVLNVDQIDALHTVLAGRSLIVCMGLGVDSTALVVALRAAGIRPDAITHADTGAEKPETVEHLHKMNRVLASWNWPIIDVCRKIPMPATGYVDLYGNCIKNETLPALAFGRKSCSVKWKQVPQDQFIKGAKRGPNACSPHPIWEKYQRTGAKIIKLIGYDCGKADLRRSKNIPESDVDFDYAYPLQIIGWTRSDCVEAITKVLGADLVPIKSACFMCPASKQWELYWLAAYHPDLLELSLILERNALTGKHSRFDAVEFGASWEELVRNADRFPSTSTTVGLGRSFAWNQWARVNDVVDENFLVRRSSADRKRFISMSNVLRGRGEDNAQDLRSNSDRKIFRIVEKSVPL